MEDATSDGKASREFRGHFDPPRMGNRHMPVDVGGPGRLELLDSGMRVEGFDAERSSCLTVLLFFAGFFGFVALGVALELPRWTMYPVFGGAAALFIRHYANSGSDYEEQDKKQFDVPWAKVQQIECEAGDVEELEEYDNFEGKVTVLLEDHDPEGLLHFYPEDHPVEVVRTLRDAAFGPA